MPAVEQSVRASAIPAGEWVVDASRSRVEFSLKHMLVATVKGRFAEFAGTLTVGEGPWCAAGAVEVASLDTGDAVRDEHLLRSADFFDVERYPRVELHADSVEQLAGGRIRIVGPLTLRGNTRAIELDGRLEGVERDADGARVVHMSLRGELNRADFGLVWNQALETGGALLGSKVKIALEISARERGGSALGGLR
jgi:polyisoprenoid-binding protein YceI